MSRLTLLRARYDRFMGRLAASDAPLEEVHRAASERIAAHLRACVENLAPEDVGAHYLCSTIIDLPLSSRALDWRRLQAAIRDHSAFVPETMVNAYECASW